jgi:hypothetical protein
MCSVQLDLRIVPKDFADENPVGTGRSDPNMEPFLTPPVNRLSLADPMSFVMGMCSKQI